MKDIHSDPTEIPGELDINKLLAQFTPAHPALNAAAVLGEAARRIEAAARTARQQVWLWRVVAMGLAASLVLVAWMPRLAMPSGPEENITVHRVSTSSRRPAPQIVEAPAPRSAATYLILRERVLSYGLDALRNPQAPEPAEPRDNDSPIRRLRGDEGI